MSITATYTAGFPSFSITSGGQPSASIVLTYTLSGDGAATTFVHPVGGFGLGTPASVTATITKQQITGTPSAWQKNTAYALNAFVQANGFIQKVTTAGTSMPGWSANAVVATNATICDNAGNLQTAVVGGTTGTSYPGNFAANMLVGTQTIDNGVTWQCTANICPNFSNVTNATTTDNTVVWTCQGAVVAATYDAPNVAPTLSGPNLTLTFNEALKAPGATNTDAYGNVFTYTAWVVTVTLTWTNAATSIIQSQNVSWTSATAVNTTVTLPVLGGSTALCGMTFTGSVTAGTVVFEVSADNVNWFAVTGTLPALFGTSSAWSAVASGNQSLQFNVAGYAFFRARLSVVITGTGTVNVAALTSGLQSSTPTTVGQTTPAQLQTVTNTTYNTSAPTPGNAANLSAQSDGFGNTFVIPYRRSQVLTATGNIASVTPANIIAAQAGLFTDLAGIVLTCRLGATAAILFGVLISDGTKSYRFNLSSESTATGGGNPPLAMNFEPPLVATTVNTAWTIALTSATDTPSVDYIATFIQQKAS